MRKFGLKNWIFNAKQNTLSIIIFSFIVSLHFTKLSFIETEGNAQYIYEITIKTIFFYWSHTHQPSLGASSHDQPNQRHDKTNLTANYLSPYLFWAKISLFNVLREEVERYLENTCVVSEVSWLTTPATAPSHQPGWGQNLQSNHGDYRRTQQDITRTSGYG